MVKVEKYYQDLYDLAAILNSARFPDEILHTIVETTARAMYAKGCSLLLLTPDKTALLRIAAYGLSPRFVRMGPVVADGSMTESLNGKTVLIENAPEDERVEYRKQVKQEGIVSILSVPVKLREEVVGVMRVYTSQPRHFTEEEIYFAEATANFGAIALETKHFYDTLQTDYDQLRQDIRRRSAEVGYEDLGEPAVVPAEEKAPVAPPGG
jgi:signal transduction protein with GAF and PtsI domain